MRSNEKRLTFANTRYLKLCTVQFLSFQIALSPCKDLLISTCANTINDVKLSRSVLGSGHGPLYARTMEYSNDNLVKKFVLTNQ